MRAAVLALALLSAAAPVADSRKSKGRSKGRPRADALTPTGRDPRGGAADPAAAAREALAAVQGDVAACSIDRRPTIDVPTFLSEYFQRKPLILTNATDTTAARERWTLGYLRETYGEKKVSLGSPYAETVLEQPKRRERLGSFIERLQAGRVGGGAEYIWHTVSRGFLNAEDASLWSPFEAFGRGETEAGEGAVPLFALGGPDSGIPFHFHKDGYAEVLWGRKLWALYPPSSVAPAHNMHSTHSEWIRKVLPELAPDARPVHCVQNPGEIYYIPEGEEPPLPQYVVKCKNRVPLFGGVRGMLSEKNLKND